MDECHEMVTYVDDDGTWVNDGWLGVSDDVINDGVGWVLWSGGFVDGLDEAICMDWFKVWFSKVV